jgi:homoserine dehydrogenase
LADSPIGIGMIGCGTVGIGVVKLLRDQADAYARRVGRPIELRRVLVRNVDKACDAAGLPKRLVTADGDDFFDTPDMPVIVEVAGGTGAISRYVRRALKAGKHVVTANKSLLAAEGPELFAMGRQHNASIAFEASCGGGIPCITALQFGLMANDIRGLYGILNGTCNYILTEMTGKGKTYDAALTEAQQLGFAEADPTLDVSGRDAAQKLAILASLAFGVRVAEDQVRCEGIDRLQLDDIRFGIELGYDIKLLGIAERDAESEAIATSVQPCFIANDQPLAQVGGSFNALSVFGHALGHSLYYGRGAGQMPTASAVVSDVLNVAAGWYPHAFAQMRLTPDHAEPARVIDPDEVTSRFYLRITALDVPGVMAKVTRVLGEAGISLSAVLQHEAAAGQFVPVVITTHAARRGAVRHAVAEIERLSEIQGPPVVLRVIDVPV